MDRSPVIRTAPLSARTTGTGSTRQAEIAETPLEVSDHEALKQLEIAIDSWLGETVRPLERARIIGMLTFAVSGTELHLDQKNGLRPQQVSGMPDAVWSALHVLGHRHDEAITAVFFPKAMSSVPAGLNKFSDLSYCALPEFSGSRLDLRSIPEALDTLKLNLRGASALQTIHLRKKSSLEITECPVDVSVFFYDEDNFAESSEKWAAVSRTIAPVLTSAEKIKNDKLFSATHSEPTNFLGPNQNQDLTSDPKHLAAELHQIMRIGHHENIEVLMKAIMNLDIPESKKYKLLAARKKGAPECLDGPETHYSGLYYAVCTGHVECVKTYIDTILGMELTDQQKLGLLDIGQEQFISPVAYAITQGRNHVLKKLLRAILASDLAEKIKFELLQAQLRDEEFRDSCKGRGIPALAIALKKDNTKCVVEFCQAILSSAFSEQQKIKLFKTPIPKKGFKNDFHALAELRRLILKSTLSLDNQFKALHLKTEDGDSQMNVLLRCGSVKSVANFIDEILESRFSENQKFFLIKSQSQHRILGFSEAMYGATHDYTLDSEHFFLIIQVYIEKILASSLLEKHKEFLLTIDSRDWAPSGKHYDFQKSKAMKFFREALEKSPLSADVKNRILLRLE